MNNYTNNFQILNGPSKILTEESLIILEIPLPHQEFEVVSTYNLSSIECFTLAIHIRDISNSSSSYSEIAAHTITHSINFEQVNFEMENLPSEGLQILVYNSPEMTASDLNKITALIRRYSYTAFRHLIDDGKKRGNGGVLS